MQINIEHSEQQQRYFKILSRWAKSTPLCDTKYLDLGTKVIQIQCYTPEIIQFLQQQMPFVLRNHVNRYDETIIFWKVENIPQIAYEFEDKFYSKSNLRFRVEMLANKQKYPNIEIMDKNFSLYLPLIALRALDGLIEAYDIENKTYYYGVQNLEPEEFIKHGHLFVQQLNVLLKSDTANLTHGAVLGYNGKGALLCARGQRGKSTLTVHSLLNGCEYVSDDYQLLIQEQKNLYAFPLYSIITLSPEMYMRMYHNFDGKFVSNNAKKDKYVFNISKYHNQFKTHYPIKLCLFPEIVSDKEPSIVPCSTEDKGRAIVQFIHSTVMQMRDLNDHATIRKLFKMIVDLPFYKFNLSPNIQKNTDFLHSFLNHELPNESNQNKLPRFLLDITFDVANILDSQTNTFYSFNKFATHLYEMLLSGILDEEIEQKLEPMKNVYPEIISDFKIFIHILKQENLLNMDIDYPKGKNSLQLAFTKEFEYKLSLLRFDSDITIDLIQKERKIK